ncbi:TPA: hypothetical protein ACKP1B_003816 [Serratia fonticola]
MKLSKSYEIIEGFLASLSNLELLSLHAGVLTQLRSRGVIRTSNNPVGDYAEWLVSKALGMTLLNNSSAGVDAIDSDGMKVQIKARRVTLDNPSRQLGALRNYEAAEFDYLIAVIFDESYNILDAYKIPHAVIGDYAKHRKHVNAHIVILSGEILSNPRVISIKEHLLAVNPPSTNEQASKIETFTLEAMSGALDKQEQTTRDEWLTDYLKAIGMKCFVTYYQRFADANVPTSDIIEQLHTQEGYTEKSCRSRLSKARKIINSGAGIAALEMIASSERIDDSLRNSARELISSLDSLSFQRSFVDAPQPTPHRDDPH